MNPATLPPLLRALAEKQAAAQPSFHPAAVNRAHASNHPRALPDPQPQRDQGPALDRADAREEKGVPRVTVRFVGRRVRPLDPDNFAGSVKDLLDGLRHAGLIPGDEPWRIRLETEQQKVAHFAEEMTVVEIILADEPR